MALELEINAATRAFLPEGAIELATPIKRAEVEHSTFDEPKIIVGRLIPKSIDMEQGHFYCLVFRFDSNEIDTNFIIHIEVNKPRQLTFEEACGISWTEEFRDMFWGDCWRPWLPSFSDNSTYILFANRNFGQIYQIKRKLTWSSFRFLSYEEPLFDMPKERFEKFASELYKDKKSELRFALRWMKLSDDTKDEIAFACDNGNWHELNQVAQWVLQVQLGHEESLSDEEYIWKFTSTPPSSRAFRYGGWVNQSVNSRDFLYQWRAAITGHFQTRYIEYEGIKSDISLCIERHISSSRYDLIKSHLPSYHEIIEAQLQLSNWLEENPVSETNGEI